MRNGEHIGKKGQVIGLTMALVLAIGGAQIEPAFASSTIDSATDKKNEAQNGLNEANSDISRIQNEQAQLREEIEALDEDLVTVIMNLSILEDDLTAKQEQLAEVQADLAQAQADEAQQYEDMKKRIQYMYERGDGEFLTSILESENMSEFLNRVEYVTEMYDYDRTLLETYRETKQRVEDLEFEVECDIAEMQEIQVNLQDEQQRFETMIAEKRGQVSDFDSQLASARDLAARYQDTINQQNEIIRQEQERIAKEEEERKKKEEEERKKKEAEEKKKQEEEERKKKEEEEKKKQEEEEEKKKQEEEQNKSDGENSDGSESANGEEGEASGEGGDAGDDGAASGGDDGDSGDDGDGGDDGSASGGDGDGGDDGSASGGDGDDGDSGDDGGDDKGDSEAESNLDPPYKTNVNGSDVVNFALNYVGNPYVYGGEDPENGIDCSAFTKFVFGHFGISLPRWSGDQHKAGQEVSYANAKPGDIICYSGHVAIYMGNGKIVHASNSAPYPAGGIKTGDATYRTIISVRRVL